MPSSLGSSFGIDPQVWNSERGEFISSAHQRLAEVLHDYQPGRYSLVYIPMNERTEEHDRRFPFAILETQEGEQVIVRYLSELDMHDTAGVLEWIAMGDLLRHRPADVLARIEARELAERVLAEKKKAEEAEERMDYAAFLAGGGRDKKHAVNLGGGRKLDRA